MPKIEILPFGTQVTDYTNAEQLTAVAPGGFRKGQDVVVAASKYLKGGGWFSSERSRLQSLQNETYALRRALVADGYSRESEPPTDMVFRFLNEFARTFPNWQKEYELLNRMIPRFLADF